MFLCEFYLIVSIFVWDKQRMIKFETEVEKMYTTEDFARYLEMLSTDWRLIARLIAFFEVGINAGGDAD